MTSSLLNRQGASEGAPGWRLLLGRLHLTVDCGGFDEALGLVTGVARIASEQNHHPEIDVRFSRVHLAVSSHDAGGLTDRDLRFCRAVSDLLDESGLSPDHRCLTEVEIAIDTMDAAAIRPFWGAVLGYEDDAEPGGTRNDDGDDAVVDPLRIGPSVWFQQLDEPRPVRNRIHLDVTVAHDEAEARIERALAAGGRLVSAGAAPSFWILADADGNEACICTWQDRD